MIRDHEKFFAFVLIGAALLFLAVMLYKYPLVDSTANSGVLQILNMIIGALISAFGAASQALFRTGGQAERQEIGQAAVNAIRDGHQPLPVSITNGPDERVPVEEQK